MKNYLKNMVKYRKIIIANIIFLIFMLFISCSVIIDIKLSGTIIGFNQSDSTEYNFKFYRFGKEHPGIVESKLIIDSKGNYDFQVQFLNHEPDCIDLLKNNNVVDRYIYKSQEKQHSLFNVFTGANINISDLNGWRKFEFKNLDFDISNFLIDTNILKFDDLEIRLNHNNEKKLFDFYFEDPSLSISKITAYYENSKYEHSEIYLKDNSFSIPEKDLPKNNYSPFTSNWDFANQNSIFFIVHSKYGLIRNIRIQIWNEK